MEKPIIPTPVEKMVMTAKRYAAYSVDYAYASTTKGVLIAISIALVLCLIGGIYYLFTNQPT